MRHDLDRFWSDVLHATRTPDTPVARGLFHFGGLYVLRVMEANLGLAPYVAAHELHETLTAFVAPEPDAPREARRSA